MGEQRQCFPGDIDSLGNLKLTQVGLGKEIEAGLGLQQRQQALLNQCIQFRALMAGQQLAIECHDVIDILIRQRSGTIRVCHAVPSPKPLRWRLMAFCDFGRQDNNSRPLMSAINTHPRQSPKTSVKIIQLGDVAAVKID